MFSDKLADSVVKSLNEDVKRNYDIFVDYEDGSKEQFHQIGTTRTIRKDVQALAFGKKKKIKDISIVPAAIKSNLNEGEGLKRAFKAAKRTRSGKNYTVVLKFEANGKTAYSTIKVSALSDSDAKAVALAKAKSRDPGVVFSVSSVNLNESMITEVRQREHAREADKAAKRAAEKVGEWDDKDMKDMFRSDAKDWKNVAKHLRGGKIKAAAKKHASMDTVARDEVGDKTYKYLVGRKSGFWNEEIDAITKAREQVFQKFIERIEQIDELSRSTLSSYVKGASRDAAVLNTYDRKKTMSRLKGIRLAADKLDDDAPGLSKKKEAVNKVISSIGHLGVVKHDIKKGEVSIDGKRRSITHDIVAKSAKQANTIKRYLQTQGHRVDNKTDRVKKWPDANDWERNHRTGKKKAYEYLDKPRTKELTMYHRVDRKMKEETE